MSGYLKKLTMANQVLLKKGSLFLFFVIFFSCRKLEKKDNYDFTLKDRYITQSFNSYYELYKSANDSIYHWCGYPLSVTSSILFNPIKIDSIFIFNKDSTSFFTIVEKRKVNFKNASSDLIMDFHGRKINNKWYFFFGSSTVLPREYYQDSVYSPMSFEELSYLAYDMKFKYFIENDLPLPDDYFDDVLGAYNCKPYGAIDYDRKAVNLCLDSLALKTNKEYHAKKLSKEEIVEIQKSIDESVRPPEPIKKNKEWWQFWKDEPKIPIFETEEWKDYLKEKYGSKWQEHL